ncbi:MAG: methionyl-tRNA formyltransferase [Clostridia bacterium]|nr:methionyl-tRNA formyltransferase [Clostridia bacterium]
MRIVFMGTPEFGVPSLKALIEAGHEIVGVFCQPDRPKGRGNKTVMCPVKEEALKHGLPVFQPQRIRLDGAEALRSLSPDLCVTAAFGQILSEENLAVPRLGTVNVHSSLLPKYRGSAPINWAIINGETVTGVTTMLTDKGMDTGDILLQERITIDPDITAGALTEQLAQVGARLLIQTIGLLEQGACPRARQNEDEMSYYPMLTKDLGRIRFDKNAQEIRCLIRGVDPWPGAFTMIGGEMFKLWEAEALPTGGEGHDPGAILCADAQQGLVIACGEGTCLRVNVLQAPGGKRMRAVDYLRGHQITATHTDPAKEEA